MGWKVYGLGTPAAVYAAYASVYDDPTDLHPANLQYALCDFVAPVFARLQHCISNGASKVEPASARLNQT